MTNEEKKQVLIVARWCDKIWMPWPVAQAVKALRLAALPKVRVKKHG